MLLVLLSLRDVDPRPVVVVVGTATCTPCIGNRGSSLPPDVVARLKRRAREAMDEQQGEGVQPVKDRRVLTLWREEGRTAEASSRAVCCVVDGSKGTLVVAAVGASDVDAAAAMDRAATLAADSIQQLAALYPSTTTGGSAQPHTTVAPSKAQSPSVPLLSVTEAQLPTLLHAWAQYHIVPLRRWMRACLAQACIGMQGDDAATASFSTYGTMESGPELLQQLPDGWRGGVCGDAESLACRWCSATPSTNTAASETRTKAVATHRDPGTPGSGTKFGAVPSTPSRGPPQSIDDRMHQLLALSAAFQVRRPLQTAVNGAQQNDGASPSAVNDAQQNDRASPSAVNDAQQNVRASPSAVNDAQQNDGASPSAVNDAQQNDRASPSKPPRPTPTSSCPSTAGPPPLTSNGSGREEPNATMRTTMVAQRYDEEEGALDDSMVVTDDSHDGASVEAPPAKTPPVVHGAGTAVMAIDEPVAADPPGMGVAASTDWFFAPSANPTPPLAPLASTVSDSYAPQAQAPLGEKEGANASHLEPAAEPSIPSTTPPPPSPPLHRHPAIALYVSEQISLTSVCSSSTAARIEHRLLGNVFVDVDDDACHVPRLASLTPTQCGAHEALPAIGFWRVEAVPPSPSHHLHSVVAVDVRIEAAWVAPRGIVAATVNEHAVSADAPSMMRPTEAESSSSVDSSDSEGNPSSPSRSSKQWCPGRWTWCLPGNSPPSSPPSASSAAVRDVDARNVRCVTLFLVCSKHYTSTREPLLVATYDFTVDAALKQRMQRLLSAQLSTRRPDAIREAMQRVLASWIPVDCRGRWLTEARTASGDALPTTPAAAAGDGGMPPSEGEAMALLFKGLVVVAKSVQADAVSCYFHPRVGEQADGQPTIHALGRPAFDMLKHKKHSTASSVSTCGWRNVLLHQMATDAYAEDDHNGPPPATQVRLAARFVYFDPDNIASVRNKESALADVHGTLHVSFNAAKGSLSGMSLCATVVGADGADGGSANSDGGRGGAGEQAGVSFTTSSGRYLFGFADALTATR